MRYSVEILSTSNDDFQPIPAYLTIFTYLSPNSQANELKLILLSEDKTVFGHITNKELSATSQVRKTF